MTRIGEPIDTGIIEPVEEPIILVPDLPVEPVAPVEDPNLVPSKEGR